MSNVKEVTIRGEMTFDATPFNADCDTEAGHRLVQEARSELLKKLGEISLPSIGLYLEWSGSERYVENRYGGKTCMVEYSITGTEAVSWGYIERLLQLLANAGSVWEAFAEDIEDGGRVDYSHVRVDGEVLVTAKA